MANNRERLPTTSLTGPPLPLWDPGINVEYISEAAGARDLTGTKPMRRRVELCPADTVRDPGVTVERDGGYRWLRVTLKTETGQLGKTMIYKREVFMWLCTCACACACMHV